jgi:hypothetical protein
MSVAERSPLRIAIVRLVASVVVALPGKAQTDGVWPELPTSGYISGRAATKEDVASGSAAFHLASNDGTPEGRPLAIVIPQYALHHDAETGADTPVVIIQAETNGDTDVIGYVETNSSVVGVGTLPEFRLLGVDRSKLPDI